MNFKEWLNTEENAYGLFEAGRSYEDREQDAIAYAIMIAHFYNDFKRIPNTRASDEELKGKKYNYLGKQVSEYDLAHKLKRFKKGKKAYLQGKNISSKYYKTAEEAGIKAGSNLALPLPTTWMDSKDFDAETLEQNAIKYAIMIANFYKDFKRMPVGLGSKEPLAGKQYEFNGKQISERDLGTKLRIFRRAKKAHFANKKIEDAYYPSAETAAEDAASKLGIKLPSDWMASKDIDADTLERNAIAYAIMIAHFYNDFKRMPVYQGSDEKLKGIQYNYNGKQISEKQLAQKLRIFRMAKKAHLGNKKTNRLYYPSAEQAGLETGSKLELQLPPNWMDSKHVDAHTLEQNAIKYAIMIAHFYNDFKRMPSAEGSTEPLAGKKYNYYNDQVSEKKLGTKLNTFRTAKQAKLQNKNSDTIYYPKAEDAGVEAGSKLELQLPPDWMDSGFATPKKFANHHDLVNILKNLNMAKNLNFQPEMICFRQGKKCLRYDGAYKNNQGNPVAVFEYQGQQHYFPENFFGGIQKFIQNLRNDEEKLKITKQNNIPFLRIPYWKNNQKPSLVKEFMQAVLNAPNNKLSPNQWKHYAVDIATPDAKQQQIIDNEFCRYFNSPKGITDAAVAALYPEIQKKWKMCQKKQLPSSA